MSTSPEFDKVRFNAGTAVFRLGYSHFNKGSAPRAPKIPRGWAENPSDPKGMIHPARLRDAVRYFDISLEIWPHDITTLNIRALTLLTLGDFKAAAKAYALVLAEAKKTDNAPYREQAEKGLKKCEEYLASA
ncbi:MAG: hypothetical protein OEW06_03960 [Gemmatimonadota bacterium]|nr:hypothetical protein [Gemmatimonadota bacterium]